VCRSQLFRLSINDIHKEVSTAAVKRYKPQATSICPTPTPFEMTIYIARIKTSAMASLPSVVITGCTASVIRLKWIRAMPKHFSNGATNTKNVTAKASKTSVSHSAWIPDITVSVLGSNNVLPPSHTGMCHTGMCHTGMCHGGNRLVVRSGENYAMGKTTTSVSFKYLMN
jgi:hypothetical protein